MSHYRVYFSDGLNRHHPAVFRALEEVLVEQGVEYRLIPDVADIWCQDFMPLHTPSNQLVKFSHRLGHPQPHGSPAPEVPEDMVLTLPFILGCRYVSLTLDGGCLVQAGGTVLVSQEVARWNAQITQLDLTGKLKAELGATRLLWLPTHPQDPLAHVQREVRLLGPNQAVLTEPHGPWAQHVLQLEDLLTENGMDVHRLPCPSPGRQVLPRHDYLSFLPIGNMLLVPVYGRPEDQAALETLAHLAPGHRIQPVHSQALDAMGGYLDRLAWVQELPDDLGDWYY